MNTFKAALRERILVADGAMGTMLHAAGVSLDRVLPELNLHAPELVADVHSRYVAAGADIVLTNTFRASTPRLATAGLERQAREINMAGVRLAREAASGADRKIFVAASIGPVHTGHQRASMGVTERANALLEQAEFLADAGVDLLLFETFAELAELVAGVEACSGLGLPIVGQLTFMEDERTLAGDEPEKVAAALNTSALTVLGVNCTLGPRGILSVLRRLSACTTIPLSAQPNAGLPRMVGRRRFQYALHNDYFARHARLYAELGASIVGGCCGTTPEHIVAICEAVEDMKPTRISETAIVHAPRIVESRERPPTLRELLEANRFVVGVEIRPPMGAEPAAALHTAMEVSRAGADFISVAPHPTARAQMSALSVASVLKLQTPHEIAVTVTTWDRSSISLQGDLLGAQAFGISNVICRTGSPPLQGDYPNLDGIWEVDSIGLIELLSSLNSGLDSNGVPVGAPATFYIGGRVNPGASDLQAEVRRTKAKIGAGVQFLVTWPVYDLDRLRALLEQLGPERVPVILTVLPLRDLDEAEFLRNEVPDVQIPEDVLSRLAAAKGRQVEVGEQIALELISAAHEMVDGVIVVKRDESPLTWSRLLAHVQAVAPRDRVRSTIAG
jgi:homocysteine S-methyltransferase